MPGLRPKDSLVRRDYFLLAAFCAVLFGVSLVGGRPLTRHEGVLPQSSREMLVDHDWVVPKSGGRPWLESPPLPQWITVGVASLFGRCDREWIVRIPPALMGTLVVLLVGYMAGGWFGRQRGILCALVAATISELTRYAWLAEDEIFLCAIVTLVVALFVRLEFFGGLRAEHEPFRFFGLRPRGMLWFFVALGATNLAKGVIFGTVVALVPIGMHFLWNRGWDRLRAYCWFWGWLAFAATALAWPIAVMQRYPDAPQVWFYDQIGRVSGNYTAINQAWWYYAACLPEVLAPWIVIVPFGLWATRTAALGQRYSPERFIWGWAIFTPIVLSIPSGKHHHYLLHGVAPWAMIAALGLVWLRDKVLAWPAWTRNPWGAIPCLGLVGAVGLVVLAGKVHWPHWLLVALIAAWLAASYAIGRGLWHANGRVATATLIGTVAGGWLALHVLSGQYFDRYRDDTRFLKQARELAPRDRLLLVNAGMGQLEAFHTLFYLEPRVIPLHNLSFLLDDRITGDEVYLITYAGDEPILAKFGVAQRVAASKGTWRDGKLDEQLTLFRLTFHDHLTRKNGRVRISPMQAMNYSVGPYLVELPTVAKRR